MNNQAENHQRRIAAEPSKELGHSFHTAQAECVAELGDAEPTHTVPTSAGLGVGFSSMAGVETVFIREFGAMHLL